MHGVQFYSLCGYLRKIGMEKKLEDTPLRFRGLWK